jgi:cell division protein DivIC
MKLLKVLGNKYTITIALFAVWMAFFDQNDYFTQRERKKELGELSTDIGYLKKEISKMEKDYTAMISDPKHLEKFARERYKMKREDEDVYIVEKK